MSLRHRVAAILICLPALAAATPYTLAEALAALADNAIPARPILHLSSADTGPTTPPTGGSFRLDFDRHVLLDHRGPGVLRLLRTDIPRGELRLTWDDAPEPQLVIPWADLAAGRAAPIAAPFVHRADDGTATVAFPLPFARALRVELDGAPPAAWSLAVEVFPPEAEVTSWWPALGPPPGAPEAFTRAEALWLAPANPPATDPLAVLTGDCTDLVYTAPRDLVLSRITTPGPLPPGLLLEVGTPAAPLVVDWARLTAATAAPAALLAGNDAQSRWWAGPIALGAGEVVRLRAPEPAVYTLTLHEAPAGTPTVPLGHAAATLPTLPAGIPPLLALGPAAPVVEVPSPDGSRVGLTRARVDGAVVERLVPPVRLDVPVIRQHADSASGRLRGTIRLDCQMEAARLLQLRLDLPLRWRATLRADGREHRIEELGWPAYDIPLPAPMPIVLDWEVEAPAEALPVAHLLQWRAMVHRGPGDFMEWSTTMRVVPPHRLDPVGEWRGELPAGELVDRLVGDFVIARLGTVQHGPLSLMHTPVGQQPNTRHWPVEWHDRLPPDGITVGVLQGVEADGADWYFPVGRHASWVGPDSLTLVLVDGMGRAIIPDSMRLYRHPAPAGIEGWSQRHPFAEWPEFHYRPPAARGAVVGVDLLAAMRRTVATPGEILLPGESPFVFLENMEHTTAGWGFAEPPRRTGPFAPRVIHVAFHAAHPGARLRLEDPRIAGARHFALQFAFHPEGGRVGIRDGEGRLAAVVDTALPREASLPVYTWFALPVPSRDPVLILEAMGPAPTGHGMRFAVERLMVLDAQPE